MLSVWDVGPLAYECLICSIGVAKCPEGKVKFAFAVIVEAPGGAAADHLEFKAKDRRPGNGYKEPALPIEVLV